MKKGITGVVSNEVYYGISKRKHIPPEYAQIGESIFMTLRNIMEKLKTALSLVFRLLQVVLSLFNIVLWKMELSSIVYRYLRSFKDRLTVKKVPRRRLDELQLWNCLVIILLLHSWDILEAQAGKYIGKDKKWHHGKYLFTVDFAHPESNILRHGPFRDSARAQMCSHHSSR